jgi:hypothetical protein
LHRRDASSRSVALRVRRRGRRGECIGRCGNCRFADRAPDFVSSPTPGHHRERIWPTTNETCARVGFCDSVES